MSCFLGNHVSAFESMASWTAMRVDHKFTIVLLECLWPPGIRFLHSVPVSGLFSKIYYGRSLPVESIHWALSQQIQWLLFPEKFWSTLELVMVRTYWASNGFSKPVLVSAKANGEKDEHCNSYYFRYDRKMSLLQFQWLSSLHNFFFVIFSVHYWSPFQKGAHSFRARICQSPVAVVGNRTMLRTGFVLGRESHCLFRYSTTTTSNVRGRWDQPWPYHRWAIRYSTYASGVCACYYRLVNC